MAVVREAAAGEDRAAASDSSFAFCCPGLFAAHLPFSAAILSLTASSYDEFISYNLTA
jgi:hypothetical protein